MKALLILLPALLLSACSTPPKSQATAAKTIQVESLLKTTKSWDGQPLPPYAKGQPEVTILKITIAPGAALPEHKHPYMNAGVLISGRLLVKTEHGKTIQLEAGDALSEVIGTWHYGSNNGDVPAEIIVVYSGIEGQPVTVKRDATHEH